MTTLRLYLLLEREADAETHAVFVTRAALARALHVSGRTIDRSLGVLLTVGALTNATPAAGPDCYVVRRTPRPPGARHAVTVPGIGS